MSKNNFSFTRWIINFYHSEYIFICNFSDKIIPILFCDFLIGEIERKVFFSSHSLETCQNSQLINFMICLNLPKRKIQFSLSFLIFLLTKFSPYIFSFFQTQISLCLYKKLYKRFFLLKSVQCLSIVKKISNCTFNNLH